MGSTRIKGSRMLKGDAVLVKATYEGFVPATGHVVRIGKKTVTAIPVPNVKQLSLLQQAHSIVHENSLEKEREYGDFAASMGKTARIATELCCKEITTRDAFLILIALKAARISHKTKPDSIMDLCAYLAKMESLGL